MPGIAPLSPAGRSGLDPLLVVPGPHRDGGINHPWPRPLPAGWTGHFDAAGPLDYRQVVPDTVVEVRVDRAPPVVAGPSLRPGPVPGSWSVLVGARDEGGPASVEVRWSIDDTLVRDWAPLDSLASGSITAAPDSSVTVEVRATDLAGRVTTGQATVPAGSWSRP